MKRCPKCQARNEDAARFCTLCNGPLARNAASEIQDQQLMYEPRVWKEGKQRSRSPLDVAAEAEASAAKAAEDTNVERYYLVPPVGEPLKLEVGPRSIVFGREEGCDFRLGSTKVSRRHAELRWKGDSFHIRDLNSQNGTFVNDEKLAQDERQLGDGDSIRLGDCPATFRRLSPGQSEDALKENFSATAVMETVQIDQPDAETSDGALTGDATLLPINEVLRRLLALHAHGALSVDVGGAKGTMKIVDGRAVEGSYAGLEGGPAIQAMASLTKGRFRFDPDPSAPPLRPAGVTRAMGPAPATAVHAPAGAKAPPVPARPGPPPPRPSAPTPIPGPRPLGAPPPRPQGPPSGKSPVAPPPGPPRPKPPAPGAK